MAIIYCIECLINGKKYIGKTSNPLEVRIAFHKQLSNRKLPYRSAFYDAVKKYGWHQFIWYTLEEVPHNLVDLKEKQYITKFGDYNIAEGGTGGKIGEYYCGKLARAYKPVAPADIEKILMHYAAGLSIKDIKELLKISIGKIVETLKDNAVFLRKGSSSHLARKKIQTARVGIPRSKNTKQKISRWAKINRKGTKNNSWKGHWITPNGAFDFLSDAAKALKISKPTLSKLCKRCFEPLNNHMIKLNPTLKALGAAEGRTPFSLGFGFEGKESY
jgi:group I intron endonuclease